MTEPAPDATPWQPPNATREVEQKSAAPEPVEPRRETTGNYLPLRETLITLLAPAAVYASQSIIIPGIDFNIPDEAPTFASNLTIGTVGLSPFFGAFLLVELAAVVIPGWRRLRDGSIAGRATLSRAAVWIGLVFVLVQSIVVSSNLRSLNLSGEPLLPESSVVQSLVIVSVFAGTSIALYVLAQVIDRHGLINGFSALLISSVLISVSGSAFNVAEGGYVEARELLPTLAAFAAIIFLAVTLFLGRRPWKNVSYRGIVVPRPASGEAAISVVASLLSLFAVLQNFGIELGAVGSLAPGTTKYSIVNAVLAGAAVLFFGWLFNRLEHVARYYPGATVADARAALRLSLFQTFVLLEAVLAVEAFWPSPLFAAFGFPSLLFSIAVALDLRREWRARSAIRDLVLVRREARPYRAYAAIRALEAHDIRVFARAFYTRTLYQFFAPYFPIDLYVPAAESERAKKLLLGFGSQAGEP